MGEATPFWRGNGGHPRLSRRSQGRRVEPDVLPFGEEVGRVLLKTERRTVHETVVERCGERVREDEGGRGPP